MLQRSKGVVKADKKADKKRQKTVTSMKGGSVEVFAPLSIAPDRAHEERFDSGPRILEKIKLHIKNLLEAKWYGVTYDIVPSEVQVIYTFAQVPPGIGSLSPPGYGPDAMRLAPLFPLDAACHPPPPFCHGSLFLNRALSYRYPDTSISGFKGILRFVFADVKKWEEFKFFMEQSDSEGATSESWFSEIELHDARVFLY